MEQYSPLGISYGIGDSYTVPLEYVRTDMGELQPTERISGEIDRISKRGNGILDYGAGEVSIGRIKESAVGETVEAIVHDGTFAVCLNERVRKSGYFNHYKSVTGQLIENPPEDRPDPGDLIGVTISTINSAGHSTGEHRGIPVRARDVEAEQSVQPGESVRMRVTDIEPTRIITTGHQSVDVRFEFPNPGEQFNAIVVRKSQSGNGVVESFAGRRINVGPVTEEAIGRAIQAVVLDHDAAFCLDKELTESGYTGRMKPQITQEAIDRSSALREALSIANVTVEGPKSASEGRVRDYRFASDVKSAYDYKCSVCGFQMGDGTGLFSVVAAHIVPFADGGPDAVENGICLCRRHHWAFDRELFYIDDDYRIQTRIDSSIRGADALLKYDGQRIDLPEDRDKWPAPNFLHDRRTRM